MKEVQKSKRRGTLNLELLVKFSIKNLDTDKCQDTAYFRNVI